MVDLALWLGAGVLLLLIVWIFYNAIMNIKRVRDAGKLTAVGYAFGYPVLFVGLLVDFLGNVLVMSFILIEAPRELLITKRLRRHVLGPAGWRKSVAVWFALHLLDAFDLDGKHI